LRKGPRNAAICSGGPASLANCAEKKTSWRCVQSQANPSPPISLFNRENMARNKNPNLRTRRRDWWQLYGLAVRIDEGGIHVLKAGFDKAA